MLSSVQKGSGRQWRILATKQKRIQCPCGVRVGFSVRADGCRLGAYHTPVTRHTDWCNAMTAFPLQLKRFTLPLTPSNLQYRCLSWLSPSELLLLSTPKGKGAGTCYVATLPNLDATRHAQWDTAECNVQEIPLPYPGAHEGEREPHKHYQLLGSDLYMLDNNGLYRLRGDGPKRKWKAVSELPFELEAALTPEEPGAPDSHWVFSVDGDLHVLGITCTLKGTSSGIPQKQRGPQDYDTSVYFWRYKADSDTWLRLSASGIVTHGVSTVINGCAVVKEGVDEAKKTGERAWERERVYVFLDRDIHSFAHPPTDGERERQSGWRRERQVSLACDIGFSYIPVGSRYILSFDMAQKSGDYGVYDTQEGRWRTEDAAEVFGDRNDAVYTSILTNHGLGVVVTDSKKNKEVTLEVPQIDSRFVF
ncbi:hypothetical protein KIPB_002966 [Kipferlia bialata]|uniref:Uncharacterized protein n=1 Tax=Kipferlia bialata TaxID=797122 RepID=A0A9K3CT24_9EUKA|nr:hypothetical protein KIPB_002966 [Kipferlia bialata]|eukprot:g2966.t1